MKANWWASLILLLGITIFQLPAQTQTNHSGQIIQPAVTNASTTNTLTFDEAKFEECKAEAEKGDCLAQINLANYYRWGTGVSQSLTNEVYWLKRAAAQNQGPTSLAKLQLGYIYATEIKNYGEAIKWYRQAAAAGDVDAQNRLGAMYKNGQGVPQDYAEALKWYRKAAEAGKDSGGSFNLIGINISEAEGQFNLGDLYFNGYGVSQDYVEALKWYRKAADAGDMDAQNSVGAMYENGQGVPQDYVEAYKWFILAVAQGAQSAAQNRDALFSFMTQEQIAEAQQLAREFKPYQESGSDNSTSPENPAASGSGFFITDDGYLISNYHVVKDATKIRLVTSAGLISAKVIQVDAANDLALLKAVGKFSPLPIVASRSAHLGGTVATIGFPDPTLQGFSPKLAKGEIASLSGAGDDPRYFQISVPVQPGNSGGALVDEHGNVIGIVSAKLDASVALAASGALPENVNYAVKSSFLLSFLESAPDVSAKLKEPITIDRKFEDIVKSARDASVLVLVY